LYASLLLQSCFVLQRFSDEYSGIPVVVHGVSCSFKDFTHITLPVAVTERSFAAELFTFFPYTDSEKVKILAKVNGGFILPCSTVRVQDRKVKNVEKGHVRGLSVSVSSIVAEPISSCMRAVETPAGELPA
jgi:hypothetical protein